MLEKSKWFVGWPALCPCHRPVAAVRCVNRPMRESDRACAKLFTCMLYPSEHVQSGKRLI